MAKVQLAIIEKLSPIKIRNPFMNLFELKFKNKSYPMYAVTLRLTCSINITSNLTRERQESKNIQR